MESVSIPNRAVFRAAEVCELASIQPYVLRSWEAEFPDLGYVKGSARVYRRADVERVLRLKHLILVDGLTLAGARRRLVEEGAFEAPPEPAADVADADIAALYDEAARTGLRDVKRGLEWILGVLGSQTPTANGDFALRAPISPKPPAAQAGKSPQIAKSPQITRSPIAKSKAPAKPKGKAKR